MTARRSRKRGAAKNAADPRAVSAGVLWQTWVAPVVIVAAVCLAYTGSFNGGFVFDDEVGIIRNTVVHQLFPLSRFLSSTQPVTDVLFALNYVIAGPEPWGFHLVNLAIHLSAALALFGLIYRTLRAPSLADRFGDGAIGLALACALLWAMHPLQTESVTYIVQRSESLAGLWYLMTLYAACRAFSSPRGGRWRIAAVLFCALAMGSKAIAVTAPVMVLLYQWTFFPRPAYGPPRRFRSLYAGLALTWLVPAAFGVYSMLLYESSDTATVGFGFAAITPWEYLASQPGVILHYLRLSLWPVGQCLDYAWPVARGTGDFLLPAVVILVLVVATIIATARRRPVGFVGCWFFIILAPTSSFVPLKDLAFEHRMYLPLAAVVVLVVVMARRFLHAWRSRAGRFPQSAAAVSILLLVGTAAALGYQTRRRNALFADPVALWEDVIARATPHARAHNALGHALLKRRELDRALEQFARAVSLDADFAPTYINRGKTYTALGRFEDAVRELRIADHLKKGQIGADGHFVFATALLETNRLSDAVEQFKLAISKNPNFHEAYYNLGNALWLMGQREQAAAVLGQAIDVKPDYTEASVNRGLILAETGRWEDAVASYRRAISLHPPDGSRDAILKAHYNLGRALQSLGRRDDARRAFQRALSIEPAHLPSREALRALPEPSKSVQVPR